MHDLSGFHWQNWNDLLQTNNNIQIKAQLIVNPSDDKMDTTVIRGTPFYSNKFNFYLNQVSEKFGGLQQNVKWKYMKIKKQTKKNMKNKQITANYPYD